MMNKNIKNTQKIPEAATSQVRRQPERLPESLLALGRATRRVHEAVSLLERQEGVVDMRAGKLARQRCDDGIGRAGAVEQGRKPFVQRSTQLEALGLGDEQNPFSRQ